MASIGGITCGIPVAKLVREMEKENQRHPASLDYPSKPAIQPQFFPCQGQSTASTHLAQKPGCHPPLVSVPHLLHPLAENNSVWFCSQNTPGVCPLLLLFIPSVLPHSLMLRKATVILRCDSGHSVLKTSKSSAGPTLPPLWTPIPLATQSRQCLGLALLFFRQGTTL